MESPGSRLSVVTRGVLIGVLPSASCRRTGSAGGPDPRSSPARRLSFPLLRCRTLWVIIGGTDPRGTVEVCGWDYRDGCERWLCRLLGLSPHDSWGWVWCPLRPGVVGGLFPHQLPHRGRGPRHLARRRAGHHFANRETALSLAQSGDCPPVGPRQVSVTDQKSECWLACIIRVSWAPLTALASASGESSASAAGRRCA